LRCQGLKRRERKKRELSRALDPKNNVLTNFFQSDQKDAPSQANDSQEANATANDIIKDFASRKTSKMAV